MSRRLTLLLCTITLVAGCSRNPERSSATSPTALSAPEPGSLLGPTSVATGGRDGLGRRRDGENARRHKARRRHAAAVDLRKHLLNRGGVVARVDAVAQVFLRPDHAAFSIHRRLAGAAAKLLVLGFELPAEIERVGARRKRDQAVGRRTAHRPCRITVNLRHHALGRAAVVAAVGAVAHVFLRPDHLAFAIDGADALSPMAGLNAVGFVGLPPHAAVIETTTPMMLSVPSWLVFMTYPFRSSLLLTRRRGILNT